MKHSRMIKKNTNVTKGTREIIEHLRSSINQNQYNKIMRLVNPRERERRRS